MKLPIPMKNNNPMLTPHALAAKPLHMPGLQALHVLQAIPANAIAAIVNHAARREEFGFENSVRPMSTICKNACKAILNVNSSFAVHLEHREWSMVLKMRTAYDYKQLIVIETLISSVGKG